MRRTLPALVLGAASALGGACHRGAATTPKAVECASTLPSSQRASTPPPAPPPIASSTIGLRAEVPTESLRAALESKVPRRLAEEHGHPMGSIGRVSYTVDRGPFTLSMAGTSVAARTDLVIHASVCKPVPGLGCVEYASCTPGLRVVAAVPGQLHDDWTFGGSTVGVEVTKRCLVTALEVDVTPEIESQARAEVAKVKTRIDASLPKLHDVVARAWELAHTPVPFADGCFALHPESLVQGPITIEAGALVVRVAVVARPTVDACEPAAGKAPPLPPLGHDPKAGDGFAIHLPVRVPQATLAAGWSAQASAQPLDARLGAARATSLEVHPTSAGLDLALGIGGTTCGTIDFDAAPGWDDAAHAIVLRSVAPASGERERLASHALELDPAALADSLRARLRYAPATDDRALAKALTDLAQLASTEGRTLTTSVTRATSEGVIVAPAGLEPRFLLEGTATLRVELPVHK